MISEQLRIFLTEIDMCYVGIRLVDVKLIFLGNGQNFIHALLPVAQNNVSMDRHLGQVKPVANKFKCLID